jgi:hypothetical protein
MRTSTLARLAVVAGLTFSTGACSASDILDTACQIGGQLGFPQACDIEIPTLPGLDLSGGFQLPL